MPDIDIAVELVQQTVDINVEMVGGGGRAPTAHAASHAHDGSDPVTPDAIGALPVSVIGLEPGQRDRGVWDAVTSYVAGDVVYDRDNTGSIWVAVVPVVGVVPASPAWTEVAASQVCVALGAGSSASGGYSAAIGPGSTASGDYSAAIGTVSTASGDYSAAIGTGSTASGGYSAAIGPGSTASGDYSAAIGTVSTASGDGDVNLGNVLLGGINADENDPGFLTANRPLIAPYGALDLPTSPDAGDPAAGTTRLVGRADGIYTRDSDGVESGPLGHGVVSLTAGSGVSVDSTDPTAPVVSVTTWTGPVALRPATGDYVGRMYLATDTGAVTWWDGVAWQAVGGNALIPPMMRFVPEAGKALEAWGHTQASPNIKSAQNVVHYVAYFVGAPMTIGTAVTQCNWVSTAGSVARLGLYVVGDDGYPTTLVGDYGIQPLTAGRSVWAVNAALDVGWYYCAIVRQSSIDVSWYGINIGNTPVSTPTATGGNETGSPQFVTNNVSGALASDPPVANVGSLGPKSSPTAMLVRSA